jgi:Ca2+-binding EF-hand superfamily protein
MYDIIKVQKTFEVNSMTQEQKEIIELLEKEKRGEITYQDLYYSLQKYPTEVKDNTIALYLLGNN